MKFTIFLIIINFNFVSFLYSTTLNVPADFSTIKEALRAARHGDIIEVEDGFYFEKNIVVDKRVVIRSKKLYGAVLDGSKDHWGTIFLVKNEADIEGFILKNAGFGILQRYSPNVKWTAHDLAILNMSQAGVSINDFKSNIGQAYLYNIIIDNCYSGFNTNDAYGMEIRNCLITNCFSAFSCFDHIFFNVDETIICNCNKLIHKISISTAPGHEKINFGSNVVILDQLLKGNQNNNLSPMDIFMDSAENQKHNSFLKPSKGLSFNIIGDIYFRLKNYDKAAEFYQNALIIGKEISSREIMSHAYYGLALNCENTGKYLKALDYYKRAIDVIEEIIISLPLIEYKSGFLKNKLQIYESAINLLLKLHQKNPLENYDEEAFYLVEKSKARAFLDKIQEANLKIKDKTNLKYQEMKNKISSRISQIINNLQKRKDLSLREKKEFLEKLGKEEEKYKSLIIKTKRENPYEADMFYPQPFKLKQIQEKLLNNNTALLEYFIGEQHSFAFLVTSNDFLFSRITDPQLLTKFVNNYLYFLNLKETKQFRGNNGGKKLYKLLIAQFEDKLRKNIKKIIIIPDRNLYYLPFETLIQETQARKKEKEKNLKYIIEDYEISYAFSASSLIHLLERKFPTKPNKDLLAIGDPLIFGSREFLTGSLIYGYWHYFVRKYEFHPLVYASKEIKSISRLFKKNSKKIFLKEKATERNIKKLKLSDFKIIHFATHGLLDGENWWRTALLLSPEKITIEDGFLQIRELFNLELNSDLVVLSACQTARGKLEKGEGIIGLGKAFFYAGTRSIISTLWEINDKSTAQFMKYFYQLLVDGKPKGEALRLAKLKFINSKYGHPFYWASFVLYGDYSSSLKISKPSFLDKIF